MPKARRELVSIWAIFCAVAWLPIIYGATWLLRQPTLWDGQRRESQSSSYVIGRRPSGSNTPAHEYERTPGLNVYMFERDHH